MFFFSLINSMKYETKKRQITIEISRFGTDFSYVLSLTRLNAKFLYLIVIRRTPIQMWMLYKNSVLNMSVCLWLLIYPSEPLPLHCHNHPFPPEPVSIQFILHQFTHISLNCVLSWDIQKSIKNTNTKNRGSI